jgi:hypothetical protein
VVNTYEKVSVGIDVLGGNVITIYIKNGKGYVGQELSRKEARQLSRALLCYADVADQLDQEWPDEKAVILTSKEVRS